jgi:hypothetical protein
MSVTVSDQLLDELSLVADEPVDALLREIAATVEVVSPISLMRDVMKLIHDPKTVNSALAIRVRTFLDTGTAVPDWASDDLLRTAQTFFADHALDITSILFYCALPSCYACGDGAQIVRATERLVSLTHRRTSETAQFIFDVVAYREPEHRGIDQFSSATRAYHSILGVRLMHAAVRNFVKAEVPEHTTQPVNQQEMLGTILAFSTVTLRGLERMGISVSLADQEAYWHLWAVVGFMLGVDQRVVGISLDEAFVLTDKLEQRLVRATPAGAELLTALLTDMNRSTQEILGPVGRLLQRVHPAVIRHLCSSTISNALGLTYSNRAQMFVRFTRPVVRFGQRLRRRSRLWRRLANWGAHRVLTTYLDLDRGSDRPPFDFGLPPRKNLFARRHRRHRASYTSNSAP